MDSSGATWVQEQLADLGYFFFRRSKTPRTTLLTVARPSRLLRKSVTALPSSFFFRLDEPEELLDDDRPDEDLPDDLLDGEFVGFPSAASS